LCACGGGVVAIVAGAMSLLGACGDSPGDSVGGAPLPTPRLAPLTPLDPERIAPEQAEAIAELAANASASAPAPHAGHVGHDEPGPQSADETGALAAGDQLRFDEQWVRAQSAVPVSTRRARRPQPATPRPRYRSPGSASTG
jgi:hypothetical protein